MFIFCERFPTIFSIEKQFPLEYSSAFIFPNGAKSFKMPLLKVTGGKGLRSIVWIACYNLSFEDSIYANLKRS